VDLLYLYFISHTFGDCASLIDHQSQYGILSARLHRIEIVSVSASMFLRVIQFSSKDFTSLILLRYLVFTQLCRAFLSPSKTCRLLDVKFSPSRNRLVITAATPPNPFCASPCHNTSFHSKISIKINYDDANWGVHKAASCRDVIPHIPPGP